MPFCYVGSYQTGGDAGGNNGIKIFYRNYGYGPVKILMIIGNWFPRFFRIGFWVNLVGSVLNFVVDD